MNCTMTSPPVKPDGNDIQKGNRIGGSGPTKNVAERAQSLTAVQLLKRSLDTFIAKDMSGWAGLCAEDVVVEFPCAPDSASRRIIGRAAIYEYLRDYPKVIDVKTTQTPMIHQTGDPNMAIAEWSASGRVISSGKPYEMSYATFVTFRNGLIINYREYWNPVAFMAAMDGAHF